MSFDYDLQTVFAAAIHFVATRRKRSGGYGATPMLPATIEDTYHALNILKFARQYNVVDDNEFNPLADEKLRSYLTACQKILGIGTKTTFQLLWCCKAAGLELDRETVKATAVEKMRTADSLEDLYCSVRILDEVLEEKSLPAAGITYLDEVLSRKWRAVDEAWMHIYLCNKLRNSLPQPAAELVEWFRACQNGDGGFGFFPGTTSYVENCHASLRALAFLGEEPLEPGLAFQFICSCQTASGGFGRNSQTASFLDATWHALAALACILDKVRT